MPIADHRRPAGTRGLVGGDQGCRVDLEMMQRIGMDIGRKGGLFDPTSLTKQ